MTERRACGVIGGCGTVFDKNKIIIIIIIYITNKKEKSELHTNIYIYIYIYIVLKKGKFYFFFGFMCSIYKCYECGSFKNQEYFEWPKF